jgi:hypothetical protein
MSRLRGRRPETPNPTFDRRLTARPVVLAKNVRNRAVILPVYVVDGPGRTFPEQFSTFKTRFLDLIRFRAIERSGNPSSFDGSSPTGGGCGLHPIPSVGLGAV